MEVKVFEKKYSTMQMDAADVVSFFNTCTVTPEQLLDKLEQDMVRKIEVSARSETIFGIQLSEDGTYWTTMQAQTMEDVKWRDITTTEQEFFDNIQQLKTSIFALKLSE